MYLSLEVEMLGLRGSFLISGLEGASGCGYCNCFSDILCDGNFFQTIFEFTPSRSEVVSLKLLVSEILLFFLPQLFRLPLRQDSSSKLRQEQRIVITDEFIYDNQQSVRELINLRVSYAIWARKLSIVPATSDEYTATSTDLGNIHTTLLAFKERMNLLLFRLPISLKALDALIKKVEEQRSHLTPVDSTPKETVPSDTTINYPSKRTLKNLRLKTDKKRLIDDDGFQTPDKRHTAKKIGKINPSLPPTTSQISNPAQAPPHLLNLVILRLRTRMLVKSNPYGCLHPKNRIPPIFVNPPDN
ncbi:hypothetical protein TNCV_1254871 [Trichonephila clavipes]|nr:hypothetical protein TNCV_1254871 [Trichonephila clavipes]